MNKTPSTDAPPRPQAAPRPKAARKKLVGWVILVLVALPAMWAGAHYVRDMPDPAWPTPTRQAPEDSDNGALAMGSEPFQTSQEEDELLLLSGLELTEALARVESRALSESEEETLRAVEARPRFVPDVSSQPLRLLALWKRRTMMVLRSALRGDPAAIGRAHRLWQHTDDLGRHSDTLILSVLSTRLGELAMTAIEFLERAFEGTELSRDAMMEWASLRSSLAASDLSSWTMTRALRAEYHFVRSAILGADCIPHDRHQTEVVSAAYFAAAHAVAEGEALTDLDPSERALLEDPTAAFSPIYNPCGHTVMQDSAIGMLNLLERHQANRHELLDRLEAINAQPEG